MLSKDKQIGIASAYMIQHTDNVIKKTAQSGGLFSGIAEAIYKKGGIVYGAALADNFMPVYIRTTSIDELYKLQGSKYVQCNAGDIFRFVEQDLKDEKTVLFSGTSCVINGLYLYLNAKKSPLQNLYTVDIICHGVASPGLWMEHIALQEKRFGKLVKIIFRDKRFGWRTCMETYTDINGNDHSERVWNDLYFTDAIMRPSCYCCKYIDAVHKPADITMGDYFGRVMDTKYDKELGVSFAICHTEKGEVLIEKSRFIVTKLSIADAMKGNLTKSVQPPRWKNTLWKSYNSNGYEMVLKRYTVYGGVVFKIKRKVLKALNRW